MHKCHIVGNVGCRYFCRMLVFTCLVEVTFVHGYGLWRVLPDEL